MCVYSAPNGSEWIMLCVCQEQYTFGPNVGCQRHVIVHVMIVTGVTVNFSCTKYAKMQCVNYCGLWTKNVILYDLKDV